LGFDEDGRSAESWRFLAEVVILERMSKAPDFRKQSPGARSNRLSFRMNIQA